MNYTVKAGIIRWALLGFFPIFLSPQLFSQEADTTHARTFLDAADSCDIARRGVCVREMARRAATIYAKEKIYPEWCYALNLQGQVATESGDYQLAITLLDSSIRLNTHFIRTENLTLAKAYNNIGFCYSILGKPEIARDFLYKALDIRKGIRGEVHRDIANSLFIISSFHGRIGEYETELSLLKEALLVEEKLGEIGRKDAILNNIGYWYSRVGDYSSAEEYYLLALEELKSAGENFATGAAPIYNNLGMINLRRFAYERALGFFHRAISIYKANFPNTPRAAISYSNIANCYFHMGNYEMAEEFFRKALAREKAAYGDNYPPSGVTQMLLGRTLGKLKKYDEGLEVTRKAARNFARADANLRTRIFECTLTEGQILFDMGKQEEGLSTFLEGLTENQSVASPTNPNLLFGYSLYAKMLSTTGQFQAAIEMLEKPLAQMTCISGSEEKISLCQNTEPFLWPPARDMAFSRSKILRDTAIVSSNPLPLLEEAKKWAQFALELNDSIRIHFIDAPSQARIGETSLPLYENSILILHDLDQIQQDTWNVEAALNIAESGKFFLLRQGLTEERARATAGVPDSLNKEIRYLKASVTRYGQLLKDPDLPREKAERWENVRFSQVQQLEKITRELETNYPLFNQLRIPASRTELSRIQARLGPEEMLIEYFFGDSSVYFISVTRESAKFQKAGDSKTIQKAIRQLKTQLQTVPDPSVSVKELKTAFEIPAIALFEKLIQPAFPDSQAQNIHQLFIIPDGPLAAVPFEILLSERSRPETPFSGLSYLFRQYAIRYGFGIETPSVNSGQRARKLKLVGFAPVSKFSSPDTSGGGFAALLNSEKELAVARNYFSHAMIKTGPEATESAFRALALEADILHLATHAVVGEKSGSESVILFYPEADSTNDGVLSQYELMGLPLQARLAILSACNTGNGNFQRGEGVLSLAWAFRMAGCPSVLMSLWQANDYASQKWIEEFYNGISVGLPLDEAAVEAKNKYLAEAPALMTHPHFWAGFVISGENSPIVAKTGNKWVWGGLGTAVLLIGLFFWRRNRRKN